MDYKVILIEILTAVLGLVLLVTGLLLPKDRKASTGYISAIGLAAILAVSIVFGREIGGDSFILFFKQLFLIAAILVTLMSISFVKGLADSRSEFFTIGIFALLGMMVMVSAGDLITLYIGLELMTISFAILTAIDKISMRSTEAGTKYILLSAMSSGILLYGMSLIYGTCGSLSYSGIISFMQNQHPALAVLGVIMLVAGFAFKISAVPFHMWTPDIYEGAPVPITAFLAVGSKAAGFAVLIRLFVQVMPSYHGVFQTLLVTLAVLSMVIGNLIAIPQTSVKRMLAFSSIAQAGYILLGLVANTKAGIGAMLYYLLLYAFANAGAFASLTAFYNHTGKDSIADLRGMWKRSPFLTATLMLSLLSMAGIPPAAGFIGKFYLFMAIVKQGYIWLVFLAIAMSVVSIYYYIVVIRTMLSGEGEEAAPLQIPGTLKTVMVVSIIATLVMGLYPAQITEWTLQVAGIFAKLI